MQPILSLTTYNLQRIMLSVSLCSFTDIVLSCLPRRDQLLDDSYRQLKLMDPDRLKGRLRIAYVNEAGAAEAGIDGGGLFKDFMEELLKQGFSPQV